MSDNIVSYVRYYKDEAGEWRWSAYAANHEKVGDSGEGYKNKDHVIKMVTELFPEVTNVQEA